MSVSIYFTIRENKKSMFIINTLFFGCPTSLNMKSKFDRLLRRNKVRFVKG